MHFLKEHDHEQRETYKIFKPVINIADTSDNDFSKNLSVVLIIKTLI